MKRILLIDDDLHLCKLIQRQLRGYEYEVDSAFSGKDGLAKFRKDSYDIVISDIHMPDFTGIEVLEKIREVDAGVIVIMMTGHATVSNALEACRLGADDYITKSFGRERLLFIIEKALRFRELQQENTHLKNELKHRYNIKGLVAHSSQMDKVMRMVGQVADSDATVLVLGESGTGKELIARAIHYNSARRDQPLVTVNCPSIPDNLLESELFGHIRGSFTGAHKDRKGKFELANGGTIFLDEIGDLHLPLQAKLLRVLQEQEFERLGESRSIKIDVRIIAATNADLQAQIRNGRFREDLYYRLCVVPVILPPLRERREDIPYLVEHFIERHGRGKSYRFEPDVIDRLKLYNWPGNVRELENTVERMLILSSGHQIGIESLPTHIVPTMEPILPQGPEPIETETSLHAAEKKAIEAALKQAGGNKSKAARILQIPRHVLLYRLKKLEIE